MPSYIVIRLVPDSPVDGGTFGTYLDGLNIKVYPANDPNGTALGETTTVNSDLTLSEVPWIPGTYVASVSANLAEATKQKGTATNDYGDILMLQSPTNSVFGAAAGIAYGSVATDPTDTTNSVISSNTVVNNIAAPAGSSTTVTVNQEIKKPIVAGDVVTFYFAYGSGSSDPNSPPISSLDWTSAKPSFSFQQKTSAAASSSKTLKLGFSDGVAAGMQVTASGITGTVHVTAVANGSITLDTAVTVAKNVVVTFTSNLNSGIVQHSEPLPNFPFYIPIPASVATALVEIPTPASGTYTDISVVATRGAISIPVESAYYNVLVYDSATPPTPNEYQGIAPEQTSLYLTLPTPPKSNAIPLTIPTDGSAPPFGDDTSGLLGAMQTALKALLLGDPDLFPASTDISTLNTDQCTRMAYDIMWSQQTVLPPAPDAVESLYTNPPNPGGSNGTDSNGNSTTNNLEQDRQKFEGTLSSYYATRNATAARLTKFVAAASAAIYCEQTSLKSTQALLEFPVDPTVPFARAVESELLVQGLGLSGPSGIHFGVPAAFFYALGASLDQSTTAVQRFQSATGDAIERILQTFATAESTNVITDSEAFTDASLGKVTSFQAARRLVALGVPSSSNSSPATVYSGTPLASLISDWLLAPAPATVPNPPPTYQNIDFNIWTQLAKSNPTDAQGYLELDLDALTQGYVIPSFKATPDTASGLILTFKQVGLGIGPGMPVSGSIITPGTTVATVATSPATNPTTTTVTLSAPVTGPAAKLTFNAGTKPVTATTNAAPSGTTLFFPATTGITQGLSVFGANIPAGTTVSTVGGTSITVNQTIPSTVLSGTVVTFAIVPSTLADQIDAWLNPQPPTIEELRKVNSAQWTGFFSSPGNEKWLPPFTQPVAPGASPDPSSQKQKAGYIALRVRAFIRDVQQFFTVSSVVTAPQLLPPGAPPVFDLPAYDPIKQAADALSLTFGSSTSTATLTSGLPGEVQTVFPNDAAAEEWLTQAMFSINELDEIASVVPSPTTTSPLPNPQSFRFSVMEALYARGFPRAKDITRLSPTDFQAAMTGTVAYDFASPLYAQALTIAASTAPSGSSGGSFHPINPDGSLVNCVPPPCLSPFGPIAYLQEMLKLSQSSTCDNPWAPPPSEGSTLGDAVTARRGNLGALLASCANLETPLPSIDIVNECLEYLATAPSAPAGVIYDTSDDQIAGLKLCDESDCSADDLDCHDPARIFCVLPEYSTPATPVKANESVEPLAFDNLKADFSSCHLPYSQALDVSRTYLRYFGSCRFEELRTFRKCITEFALQPANPPTGFLSYVWRYPVRIEIAIEYLGITPEEYTMLFQGTTPLPCGQPANDNPNRPPTGDSNTGISVLTANAGISTAELYGYSSSDQGWMNEVGLLSEFLPRTCLTYCEFLELSKSGILPAAGGDQRTGNTLPECEPCCLKDYRLTIPEGDQGAQVLLQLALFIRLWRKMKHLCGARYTFVQLYDICTVLKWFSGTTMNPEFIRQLAAFQMLRDHFDLPLVDRSDKSTGTTGADRTHLLALWVGSTAKKWNWAVAQLIEGVESHARRRYNCDRRRDEDIAHMVTNLDALSRLAGFNPPTASNPSTDTWNSTPGCTLRFAEVLAKIRASTFRAGELLYLFNATPPEDCRDPFPPQDSDDVLSYPFDLPEGEREHSLWKLREELLGVEVAEEEVCEWTWPGIVAEFRARFGYAPPSGQDPLLSIGQHFFPEVLECAGFSVSGQQRQYRTALSSTTAWNSPPGSPFQYDAAASQLWVQMPLNDEAVAAKLSQLPQLNGSEQAAVQDLYFAPRADLAFLAFLFPDWQDAEIHLIQECEEGRRWEYFRRHFALADARRKAIARHLAKHVAHRTGCHAEELESIAGLVLSSLLADENTGAPWESDSGAPPPVMWTPSPSGGAIAALLGLAGTGLLGEYELATPDAGGTATGVIWREVRGPLDAFGHERDRTNAPVPTVIPSLGLPASASPLVSIHNGYAVKTSDGKRLGGAEGFRVRWSGVLVIECEGEYAFHAGAPTPEGERPDCELAEKSQWRLTLTRGSKTWVVLNHDWPGDPSPERNMPRLRGGAYNIVIEYNQPAPDYSSASHLHPQRTSFEVKYVGPDSDDCLVALPLKRLYRDFQNNTLDDQIPFLAGSKNAQAFLRSLYTSTIRDMRRTYQRAFKALLLAGKLGLSARRHEDGQTELGYMLSHPPNFTGDAYYRTSTTFLQHLANFDFNFLPLQDNYHPSPIPVPPAPPDRSNPSLQRTQAMFDWWEQLFDYDQMGKDVFRRSKDEVWRIFPEALEAPTDAAQLLRYIGADPKHGNIDLRFYQDQSAKIYNVSSTDLEDSRWLVRVWRADQWVRRLTECFHPKDISKARPDIWAAEDPSAPMPASGVSETGNANLLALLLDGCLENGEPRRYKDLGRLNDELRERGRNALISYLCAADRVKLPWSATPKFAAVPGDLTDLLLLDVETGLCEKASRIDEAIIAVQTFVRRSRLGLEPAWKVNREFTRLWDSRFDTYRVWERCKRREVYRENWIEWFELHKSRRIEAFRFLESKLRASTLTLAAPGGLDWWADDNKSLEHVPERLQRRVPSELQPLSPLPNSKSREGLGVLGTPEYANRPTWLAAVSQPTPGSAGFSSPSSSPSGSAASGSSAHTLALAVAAGSTQNYPLPLWMESAMKMGTQFVRVAAAGIPQAALRFAPRGDESSSPCCCQCGHDHPVLIDEYYFWLVNSQFYAYADDTDSSGDPSVNFTGSYQFGFQDSYYDAYQQQSAEWNEEDQVPSLLAKWQPTPAVRLAWCRVHNGQFGQPRKSQDYVAIDGPADLNFLGRDGDSLYFEVSNSAPMPPGYGGTNGDTSPPGFRYDLPSDEAVGLPQVLKPPASVTPSPYPGGLLSYPFFAYHEPGASVFPGSWFSTSVVVAETLRTHFAFEAALKWYQRAFDPLTSDCTWMDCDTQRGSGSTTGDTGSTGATGSTTGTTGTGDTGTVVLAHDTATAPAPAPPPTTGDDNNQSACCDSSKVTDETARDRAVTLLYCQALMDWGDHSRRRHRSPEAFQIARLLYDTVARVTGRCPQTILLKEPASPQPVSTFTPAHPPLNPRLMDLYSLVEDRLGLIHRCFDSHRLHDGVLGRDMCYFGDSPWRDGWRTAAEPCADEDDCCHRLNPYRFLFQISKAIELAAKVKELGAALLSAYKDGDGECLASIRAVQERELLALGLSIRQDQWRDADWQVQALQQTKDVSQTNLLYYANLYQNGLVNDEIQNLSLSTNAIQIRTGANITDAIAESFHILPDSFVGAMSSFIEIPTGTKLAGLFETISKIMRTVGDIQSETAAIDITQAGWDRRSVEWFHQMTVLPIEIQQIELQILGAQRRRDQALQELNNQQRQIENSTEVLDFLRDKFTATDLFLYLQKETAGLHRQMHKLARCAALEAERAFNFERGHTTRHFIPGDDWDNLHEGLMAGDRLEFALRRMEKAYLDENIREYELTKHFSLRLHFPMEFLRLKMTGHCDVELPEWMFDLDYPGQYMRRIRNVSLTIPCVTGPYTGVHCRATLLSSRTRIDPRLDPPSTRCCCECQPEDNYDACVHDPRVVHSYAAREAIATSSGQNDTGVFDLRADERYAPFEYQGAVSHWRLELPHENNYIDMETLTDVVMQVNYTSREGGEPLRRAASEAARKHLPGSGWCFFDVRHEFPDAWQLLRDSSREKERGAWLDLRLERRMFPFVPGLDELSISKMAILFHAREHHDCDGPEMAECPCPREETPACRVVEFRSGPRRDHDGDCAERVSCIRSDEWPDLYYGLFDTRVGPVGRHGERRHIGLRFPTDIGDVESVYVLFQYHANSCESEARPPRGHEEAWSRTHNGSPTSTKPRMVESPKRSRTE
jgi:Tc toxin complex TcA C-terminal TcB-binding domain